MSQPAPGSIFPSADRSFSRGIGPFCRGSIFFLWDRSFCRGIVLFLTGSIFLPRDRSFSHGIDLFGGGTDLRAYRTGHPHNSGTTQRCRGYRKRMRERKAGDVSAPNGARCSHRLCPVLEKRDRNTPPPANTSANVESSGRHPFEDSKTRGTLSSTRLSSDYWQEHCQPKLARKKAPSKRCNHLKTKR